MSRAGKIRMAGTRTPSPQRLRPPWHPQTTHLQRPLSPASATRFHHQLCRFRAVPPSEEWRCTLDKIRVGLPASQSPPHGREQTRLKILASSFGAEGSGQLPGQLLVAWTRARRFQAAGAGRCWWNVKACKPEGSRAWRCTPVVPPLGEVKQED